MGKWDSKLKKVAEMREERIPMKIIEKTVGMSTYSLDHICRRYPEMMGKYKIMDKTLPREYLVEPFGIESYDKFEVIKGDAILMGDTHIPYHSVELINRAVMIAKRDGIKILIIGGDFTDQKLVSIHLNVNSEKQSRKLTDEFKITHGVLKTLGRTFEEIILICGDHDARVLKMLKYQANWKDLYELYSDILSYKGVRASDYYYGILKSGDKTWRLTHPDRATRRPTTKALAIARKFDQNVVQFHGHTFGMEFTENGKYLAVSMGCATDAVRHEYAVIQDCSYPKWRRQFGKIQNGTITIYDMDSQLTDWGVELGRKYAKGHKG